MAASLRYTTLNSELAVRRWPVHLEHGLNTETIHVPVELDLETVLDLLSGVQFVAEVAFNALLATLGLVVCKSVDENGTKKAGREAK
jgi:hypothetical protein